MKRGGIFKERKVNFKILDIFGRTPCGEPLSHVLEEWRLNFFVPLLYDVFVSCSQMTSYSKQINLILELRNKRCRNVFVYR